MTGTCRSWRYHWFVAAVSVAALAAGSGCRSSTCTVDRSVRRELEKAKARLQLIRAEGGSGGIFEGEYADRADELGRRADRVSQPFACKETEREERAREARRVLDGVDLLEKNALRVCLGKVGPEMRAIDALRAFMKEEEDRAAYEKERNADPAEFATLEGCLEHFHARTRLREKLERAAEEAAGGGGEPDPKQRAALAVRELERLAGERWWEGRGTGYLDERFGEAMRWIEKAGSPELRQRAERARRLGQERLESERRLAAESVRAALEACDGEAFGSGVERLAFLGEAPEVVEGYRRDYEKGCEVRGAASALYQEVLRLQERIRRELADPGKQADVLREVADFAHRLPEQGTELAAAVEELGADLKLLRTLGGYAEAILEGDEALARGDLEDARAAYREAAAAGDPLGLAAFRMTRVDVERARMAVRSGSFEKAWTILAGLRGGDPRVARARREAARAALEAARDGSDVLRWARRAEGVGALTGASSRALERVVTAAAGRDANAADRSLGLRAFRIRLDRGGGAETPALVAAVRLLHEAARAGELETGGFQAWLGRIAEAVGTAPGLRPEERQHLRNLPVYWEIGSLVADAVGAVLSTFERGDRVAPHVRDRVLQRLLDGVRRAGLVSTLALAPSSGEPAELLRMAGRGGGYAVARDGRLAVLVVPTRGGDLVAAFDLAEARTGAGEGTQARLRLAAAEALGLATAAQIEMISGRTDLPVERRKQLVWGLVEGVRGRMAGLVLAYGGLFGLDGRLEVPGTPARFFLVPELAKANPVFQDAVSRRALETEGVLHQRHTLQGHLVEDIAVAVMRGRNKVGILRFGVLLK